MFPPASGNITVSSSERLSGDTATYTCDSGYELDLISGSEVRTCQAGGTWSGFAPACVGMTIILNATNLVQYQCLILVTCEELKDPANGTVSMTGQMSGDNATYNCDSEYELNLTSGSEVRTCQADGTWSGSAPTCFECT